MHAKSIEAYSPRERVARYDRDMAIMHPNRAAMVGAVVDTLPYQPDARLHLLDLGIGTGILAHALLEAFPNARVTGIDRFATAESTRAYLDELETQEGDCPQTLHAELESLRGAGLRHTGVFWQNTREAVYGGFKAG